MQVQGSKPITNVPHQRHPSSIPRSIHQAQPQSQSQSHSGSIPSNPVTNTFSRAEDSQGVNLLEPPGQENSESAERSLQNKKEPVQSKPQTTGGQQGKSQLSDIEEDMMQPTNTGNLFSPTQGPPTSHERTYHVETEQSSEVKEGEVVLAPIGKPINKLPVAEDSDDDDGFMMKKADTEIKVAPVAPSPIKPSPQKMMTRSMT